MYEECIECMALSGLMEEAKKLCKERLTIGENPKLLCTYGDIMNDYLQYKKAWKLSNKRYPRAQKSLGRYYFSKGLLEKSIKAF